MAALNKCNPTQLLILHIIKFLIYTLCFHGPTHNSLVLNSWVVKTNTLDKCWSLYLLFFGWQFSFSLPHFKLNIKKGFWSWSWCFLHPLKKNLSDYCSATTDFTDRGRSRGRGIPDFFLLIQDIGVPWKTLFSVGGFQKCFEVKRKKWLQKG